MASALALYRRYVAASLRSQLQYPASVLLQGAGHAASTALEFVGIWALFGRFGRVAGWHLGEVAVFYGLVNITFALADMLGRGFEVFGDEMVKTGAFDRLLLRPRSTVLQLAGHEIRLTRLGRLLQGAVVLAIGSRLTGLAWDAPTILLLGFALAGGIALFTGILVLQATLSFWTVESLEVAHILTYGGVEAAQFPLDIYARWFRTVLVFVVPIGGVAYYPVLTALGRADPLGAPGWVGAVSPLAGFLFLGLALLAWRLGVRRYVGAGS